MIQTIKQNKKAVLAFLLALVMVMSFFTFLAPDGLVLTVSAASYGENGMTTFAEGDQILVVNTLNGDPEQSENRAIYTYTSGQWKQTSGELTWVREQENTFKAYYPATQDFTLPIDQSSAEKLAAADRMECESKEMFDNQVNLRFKHLYAKVTFNVTFASEFDEADTITSLDVMTIDDKTVNAYVDGTTVSAIITPGTYTDENNFLSITVSDPDNPLTVKVPAGGLTFAAGTHYTFNLKVGKDKVEIETVTVNGNFPGGWNEEVNLNADADVTVGKADKGKTQWEDGDFIVIDFTSDKYGNSLRGVGYRNNVWTWTMTPHYLSYLENENPTVNAIYSPYYTIGDLGDVVARSLDNSDSVKKGECEFIKIGCTLSGKTITADFSNATRNYSRLRIVAQPDQKLRVTVNNFLPAGGTAELATGFYDLTADANGNAFLYGIFAEGGKVEVRHDDARNEDNTFLLLGEYTFTDSTETGTSYALDATGTNATP